MTETDRQREREADVYKPERQTDRLTEADKYTPERDRQTD